MINKGERMLADEMKGITIYDVMKMEGSKQFLNSISRSSKRSAKTYSAGLLHFQKF